MSSLWCYLFVGSWIVWCVFWTKVVVYVFDYRVAVYKRISPEMKKKYYEFGRWDFHNYSKLPKLLIGYTGLPIIRAILVFIIIITTYLSLRIILLGSDLQKPLPKWKRFLAKTISSIKGRLSLAI